MLIHFIGDAQKIKLIANGGDRFQFSSAKNFAGRIRGRAGNNGAKRKTFTLLPFTTMRA
jgi:hypothetical protein